MALYQNSEGECEALSLQTPNSKKWLKNEKNKKNIENFQRKCFSSKPSCWQSSSRCFCAFCSCRICTARPLGRWRFICSEKATASKSLALSHKSSKWKKKKTFPQKWVHQRKRKCFPALVLFLSFLFVWVLEGLFRIVISIPFSCGFSFSCSKLLLKASRSMSLVFPCDLKCQLN